MLSPRKISTGVLVVAAIPLVLTACAGQVGPGTQSDNSLAAAPALSASTPPSTTAISPEPSRSVAIQDALTNFDAFAKNELTGGPMTVSYVLATANTAESTLYGDVSHSTKLDTSHAAVIALVATGTFDGSDEKTPPGVAPTPGKYLTRIVNLESGA